MSKRLSEPIKAAIRTIRGCKVILDQDLAAIYGVATKVLNQAVKRNRTRFTEDLAFRLTRKEASALSAKEPEAFVAKSFASSRSQSVTLKRGLNIKYLPYAFTEHGAIMAATVLKSPEAIKMSLFVIRAFVRLREQMATNTEILRRLGEIDRSLLQHDQELSALWDRLQLLLDPTDNDSTDDPKPDIGFHVREESPAYRAVKKRKRTRA